MSWFGGHIQHAVDCAKRRHVARIFMNLGKMKEYRYKFMVKEL
jgi:hypothetical protein